MSGTIALTGGGKLTLREEGAQVHAEAVRPEDGRGLYKVWLRGGKGRLLLGTLAPEGGQLRLCRRISRSSLEQAGCWPVTGGECVLAFSFQGRENNREWERCSGAVFEDEVLRSAAGDTPLLLRRENGGAFQIAARFDVTKPFPIPPLFCLARTQEMQGHTYVEFAFDRLGTPVLPEKKG